MLGLSRSGAFVLGPAVAGVVAAATNPGIVFVVDAVTFAVSATSLALLRPNAVAREGVRASFRSDLVAGWHELTRHTWLWVIVAWASTFLGLVVAPFLTLGPVVAKESFGGPAAWGVIAAGWGGGMLCGGLLALRWKPARPMVVCCLVSLLVAPPVALLGLRAPVALIAVLQVVAGAGMGFFAAVWQTTLQQQVPEESLSRVSAWDWMGSFAFLPLGLILAGPVSAAIGIETTLLAAAVWCVVSTLVVLAVPGVREIRRKDATAETPVAVAAVDPALVFGAPER